jgi:hypothetical protein
MMLPLYHAVIVVPWAHLTMPLCRPDRLCKPARHRDSRVIQSGDVRVESNIESSHFIPLGEYHRRFASPARSDASVSTWRLC